MKNETRGRPSKGLSAGRIGLCIGEANKQWLSENVENISVFIRELVEKEIATREIGNDIVLNEAETEFLMFTLSLGEANYFAQSKGFNAMFNRSLSQSGFRSLLEVVKEKKEEKGL